MLMAIVLPMLSIPIILSNLSWLWKVVIIVIAALGGALWGIGIDAMQKALRKIFGLPPIDEDTGQVVKEKDEKSEEEK